MKYFSSLFITFIFSYYSTVKGQSYCKPHKSKFNRTPSEFVSDYYNLNVSANIVAERSAQLEPAILLPNVGQGQNKDPFLVSGTCLLRFGLSERIEFRTQISPSSGYYAEIQKAERKNYYDGI